MNTFTTISIPVEVKKKLDVLANQYKMKQYQAVNFAIDTTNKVNKDKTKEVFAKLEKIGSQLKNKPKTLHTKETLEEAYKYL